MGRRDQDLQQRGELLVLSNFLSTLCAGAHAGRVEREQNP